LRPSGTLPPRCFFRIIDEMVFAFVEPEIPGQGGRRSPTGAVMAVPAPREASGALRLADQRLSGMPSQEPYDLEALVEAQRAYFRSGATRDIAFRRLRLREFATLIESRSESILDALAADLGKPRLEAYVSELYFTLAELRLFIARLERWSRPQRVRNPFFYLPARSEVRREPYGCALVASPWNYPFQLALSPLLSAVAAGNCVVLKPSEFAPATSRLLAELVAEVFNPQHVAVVPGGPETGAALLELPFDFYFYTGSETVGRLYAAAAARHLAPAVLELGGKCPCLVLEDAPLERSAERIVAGKFFNAGQTCIAPDFVLVPRHRREALVEALRARLESCYGGGLEGEMAHIVNDAHYARLLALAAGAEALRVGENVPERRIFAPVLLPEADWDHPAMEGEIFGPVLPVLAYDSLGDALDELAHRPTPLALYAFSRDRRLLEEIAARVPSGSVGFNDCLKQGAHLGLPFGGSGRSGYGRYRGRAGFETFSQARSYLRRPFWKDPFLTAPPYGDRLKSLRRFLK